MSDFLKIAKLNKQPEIFHTIQGEGKNMGMPSVFIRLSLCNLYCVWCDTDYTWNWENTSYKHQHNRKYSKKDYIINVDVEDVIKKVTSYSCPNIVITGGEPLLQQKGLEKLTQGLIENIDNVHIEIETNGTIIPSTVLQKNIHQYNVSLKLKNAEVEEKHRLKPKAITFFASSEKSNFKFVVDSSDDLSEILTLIETYKIDSSKVYLMPQGMLAKTLVEKQHWLIDICKKYSFNYTDRMHIHLYGSKRGV